MRSYPLCLDTYGAKASRGRGLAPFFPPPPTQEEEGRDMGAEDNELTLEELAWRAEGIVVGGWTLRVMVPALLTVLVAMGYATEAYAAPGDLDTSFGSGGKVTTAYAEGFAAGRAVAVQDDDKVVVAGYASNDLASTGFDFAAARYNPNGTLDTAFSGDGKVTTPIGAGDRKSVV